jgi:diguanylate cyclase (GGDEF)-like protein
MTKAAAVKGKKTETSERRVRHLLERQRYLENRVRELSALYEISRIVETADEPEAIFKRVMDVVRGVIPCAGCTLFLLSQGSDELKPAYSNGPYVNPLDSIQFTLGKGLSAWVAQEKRPILLSRSGAFPLGLLDDGDEKNVQPRLGTSYLRSFAAVPLLLEGGVVGVLHLYHSEPNVFDEDATRLLSIVASQVAATVKRVLIYQQLQQQATMDSLTGLYNRGYLQRRLREEIQRAKRYKSTVSLLMIDADNFKQINDNHGHPAGDFVLKSLAALLRDQMRDTDLVARYGGEEFAALLPHADVEAAQRAGERVCEAVRRLPVIYRRHRLKLSVSVGVASFPHHAQSGDPLVQKADQALYQAKGLGKDRVCVAEG